MIGGRCALLIVDVQRYYLLKDSSFHAWSCRRKPDALDYIGQRVYATVVPALKNLIGFFRQRDWPVAYALLAGEREDRGDLHRYFRHSNMEAQARGFKDLYPLRSQEMAKVIAEIEPEPKDLLFHKTSFSAFSTSDIEIKLRALGVDILVMAGLATSQCVETTARDASDHGFSVVHIEDAQADYSQDRHNASLYASAMVCGGWILSSADFMASCDDLIEEIDRCEGRQT